MKIIFALSTISQASLHRSYAAITQTETYIHCRLLLQTITLIPRPPKILFCTFSVLVLWLFVVSYQFVISHIQCKWRVQKLLAKCFWTAQVLYCSKRHAPLIILY